MLKNRYIAKEKITDPSKIVLVEEVGSWIDFGSSFYKPGLETERTVCCFSTPKKSQQSLSCLIQQVYSAEPLTLRGGWLSFDTRQTNWFIDWLIDYHCLDLLPENTDWRNKCRVNTGPLGSCAAGSRAKIGPDARQCQQAAEWLQGSGWATFFIWVPGQKC